MRILVLFAHPRLRQSVVQRAMLAAITGLPDITVRDLYADYPDLMIDARREQAELLAHDVLVLQHPLYWYSSPAIIKEWLDIVLEEGWAYGVGGKRLHGKFLLNAISTGGPQEAYHGKGRNRFPVRSLLAPFDQTAYLCGMGWLEPFVVHAGRKLDAAALSGRCERYRDLLVGLRDGRLEPQQHLAQGFTLPSNFERAAARHANAT
ncbi:MAG TPA: NAD(P)H-dependent oxidoreductase [Gammaproteobacteria bacterium]|nr:NAD(P)H-dependent oxidoreductase [Gammaproteobacteria bacterium]